MQRGIPGLRGAGQAGLPVPPGRQRHELTEGGFRLVLYSVTSITSSSTMFQRGVPSRLSKLVDLRRHLQSNDLAGVELLGEVIGEGPVQALQVGVGVNLSFLGLDRAYPGSGARTTGSCRPPGCFLLGSHPRGVNFSDFV